MRYTRVISVAGTPHNPLSRKSNRFFYILKDQFISQRGSLAKRSFITSIQSCIQSFHIDQTDPCSNTKTPILSKFSPCSHPLPPHQLVTARSHRLARTTNPLLAPLYQPSPHPACTLSYSSFQKPPSLLPTSLLELPSRVFGAW